MKNKISAKLQRCKFISRLFEILSYPDYAACLPLTTPPHGHNTIHFQPLCSSLNVLSSYIMLPLCFPLCIVFFSFTPQFHTTSSLPVKIPPLLWSHPWLPQTGWMHPPIIGYVVLLIAAVTFMPIPVNYKPTEGRATCLFIFVFPGPRIAWQKVGW